MKKVTLIIIALILTFPAFSQQNGDTIISNNPANLKLKVYYFHITNRCHTCISIETNIRKTINENFLNQLETGIIDLYIMNCELPENQTLVKKYDAYGATLALTSYTNGKEQKTEDLTNWAFQKIHSSDVFVTELKLKIEDYLK
ncbi:MAG: nitrophenyl compound nitroreductase subunit ArsF family protein [Bacteroidota bacterium]